VKDFLHEFKTLALWQKSLFLVVLSGFIFLFGAHSHGQDHELPPATDCTHVTSAKTVYLSMNDKTISPKKSRVSVCDTVVIANTGSEYRQPALGTHPHHLEYPGYEAEVLIGTGENFSVTIVHTGRFLIHDHVDPSINGTITVSRLRR
jgi:hypothetical protein